MTHHRKFGGTSIYVATTGNDTTGDGTIGNPYATPAKAESVVTAGQKIVLRGGTYTLASSLTFNHSGTAGNPITVMAYPGETPILNGPGSSSTTVDVNSFGNYRTYNGLTIQNLNHGMFAFNVHHNIFRACNIHDCHNHAILIDGTDEGSPPVWNGTAHDNQVLYCTFSNTCMSHSGGAGGYAASVTIIGSDNSSIIGCTDGIGYGDGLLMAESTGIVCKNNTCSDKFAECIYLSRVPGCIVDSNFCYGTTNVDGATHHTDGLNVSRDENVTRTLTNDAIQITNNMFVGTRHGFYYTVVTAGNNMTNAVIAFNTFICSSGTPVAVACDTDTPPSGNVISNNIMYLPSAGTNQNGSWTGYSGNHNCWFNGSGGPLAGTGDITSNPNLASPGTLTAAACKPTAGSPVLGAGTPVSGVTTDFFGNTRSATNPSMGASETI